MTRAFRISNLISTNALYQRIAPPVVKIHIRSNIFRFVFKLKLNLQIAQNVINGIISL